MRREHLRAVIWPRQSPKYPSPDGKYRYAIIGVLISDSPLQGIEGSDELLVDGYGGISHNLEGMPKRPTNVPPGEADNILCMLSLL